MVYMDISKIRNLVLDKNKNYESSKSIKEWDLIIEPSPSLFKIDFKQLWKYRDLIFLLVRRDFVSVYKQTILGPIWLFVQPILTTITYILIFTKIAQIDTQGVPPALFYMTGIIMWTYFSDCLSKISNTFITNANVFGKVYFPRLVMPFSVVISNLIKFGVQFLLLAIVWTYYYVTTSNILHLSIYIILLPAMIAVLAGLSMSLGIIISSFTAKYRDLTFLIGFGLQLMMFATPIVYPLAIVPDHNKYKLLLNPVTPLIEGIKYSLFGKGLFSWSYLLYSLFVMIILLLIGIIVFNRTEKSFVDTV
ncbi:MAG TPA: ABC transporter permease [Bacteroidia bacterium]|nr:ABC transporter permease [Bacteroidia bacterium]